jgi:hypothetical protein
MPYDIELRITFIKLNPSRRCRRGVRRDQAYCWSARRTTYLLAADIARQNSSGV